MLQHSKKHIMLCDSNKFGLQFSYILGRLDDEVDELVSDKPYDAWRRQHMGEEESVPAENQPT